MDQNIREIYPLVDEGITFFTIAEKALNGILIVSHDAIHYTNQSFREITGYTESDIMVMSPWDMVHPDERSKIRTMGLDRLKKLGAQDYYETQWIHKNGHRMWVEVRAALLENTDPLKILVNIVDISQRKTFLEALKKREADLETQSKKLEETNTALKVILRQRNIEAENLKKNIQFNIDKLVMPYIDELCTYQIKPKFKAFLQTIKANLEEITAPHIRKFTSQYERLSPKQVEVISLIRQKKTSKEIAEIMGISKAAVDFHRNIIRKKLQLNNKKINLRTYLDLKQPDSKNINQEFKR